MLSLGRVSFLLFFFLASHCTFLHVFTTLSLGVGQLVYQEDAFLIFLNHFEPENDDTVVFSNLVVFTVAAGKQWRAETKH